MKQVWRIGLNDLRRMARDRMSLFWMLLFPVALMWFFGSMGNRGTEGPPRVRLEVVDQDGGWLARELIFELGRAEQLVLDESKADPSSRPTGRRLVIPEGFTDGVLVKQQQELVLQSLEEANADFSFAAEVHVLRVIVRSLGRLVELDRRGELVVSETGSPMPVQDRDDELAARFRLLGTRPELVQLAVTTAGAGTPVPTGLSQSVPGILTMMVLMMTLIYGGVFLATEKQDGTLRRQAASPLATGQIVAGKLFGRLMICGVQVLILLAAGRFVFGMDFGHSPVALGILMGSYALAVASLATLLGAAVRTPDQASSIGWLASMVLAAMGGCWWPSEVMPGWLWTAAHVLPTAWAMDGLHGLISFGRGVDFVVMPSLALCGFALVFSAVGARLLDLDRG